MLRLAVRFVVESVGIESQSILAKIESDQFDPDHLDLLVNSCLSKGLEEVKNMKLQSLQPLRPEISVVLTADDDSTVRPSLHLGINTIQRLAEAGASFDFDPYV